MSLAAMPSVMMGRRCWREPCRPCFRRSEAEVSMARRKGRGTLSMYPPQPLVVITAAHRRYRNDGNVDGRVECAACPPCAVVGSQTFTEPSITFSFGLFVDVTHHTRLRSPIRTTVPCGLQISQWLQIGGVDVKIAVGS